MKYIVTVLFFYSVLAAFTPEIAAAQSCSVTRENLKQKVVQSMEARPALQDFIFGPLSDGRRVRIQFEYVATGKGTGLVIESEPKCVSIDRVDIARANMILDAFSECARLGRCDLLPEYVDRIFKTQSVANMVFFETLDNGASAKMKNWCLRIDYANRWLGRFRQMTSALQLHEIAHVVLQHNTPTTLDQEAEADGFSAALANMVSIPTTAAGAFLAQRVEAQRNFEDTSASHPPSECRVEAQVDGLSVWYSKRPQFPVPKKLVRRAISNWDNSIFAPFMPRKEGLCKSYAPGFHRGVSKAHKLVNSQSGFKFLFEDFGRRCTVNGG